MSTTIAIVGKGGTGKTTISSILIKYLVKKNKKPILCVDADPNSNLNEVLGVEVITTLGEARDKMKVGNVPSGMTKDVFISMKLEESIIETKDFDLIVMGQPQGRGCYCAANTLLSGFLEKLSENYPYIVVDNEAGMEHISRLTTKKIDILLIIADSSHRSIQAGNRINELTKNLDINIDKKYFIINKIKKDSNKDIQIKKDVKIAGYLHENKEIYDYDSNGKPLIEIPENNIIIKNIYHIFDNIIC